MYIYFIRKEKGGPIKIGTTADPGQRLVAIQGANPDPLCIVGVAAGGRGAENRIHKVFAKDRLHGEWFQPTPRLLALVERLPSWDEVREGAKCPRIVSRTDTYRMLYQAGYSAQEIALYYGVSRQAIHNVSYQHPRIDKRKERPLDQSVEEYLEAHPDMFSDELPVE